MPGGKGAIQEDVNHLGDLALAHLLD
jgi:hypothetical protein